MNQNKIIHLKQARPPTRPKLRFLLVHKRVVGKTDGACVDELWSMKELMQDEREPPQMIILLLIIIITTRYTETEMSGSRRRIISSCAVVNST